MQSVGSSDLDTSSMILDHTSLDAPFFHHSSIPFLSALWRKTDRVELQQPMGPMESIEPIKPVSLSSNPYKDPTLNPYKDPTLNPYKDPSLNPYKDPSLNPPLYSMPENQWVDRREAPAGPMSDSVPERYLGPIYPAYQPTEYEEPHFNDYYQRFGNYSSSNNYNLPGYNSQNVW